MNANELHVTYEEHVKSENRIRKKRCESWGPKFPLFGTLMQVPTSEKRVFTEGKRPEQQYCRV